MLITDDEGIHQINLEQRGIDRPTDVLSFPMFNYRPGQPPADGADADPATGLTPLGDMVISWSGPGPRRRSTAIRWSGNCAIWPSIRCSTCWAMTIWTREKRRPKCGQERRLFWANWV